MFSKNYSLLSIPDLSKWNISKVNDLSFMFFRCDSLLSLPDISKWNISNVKNMSSMFYNCCSLTSFPDLANWKKRTSFFVDMDNMFQGCFNSLNFVENLNN